MATLLTSCSVYESDAHKFLRAQGLEYKQQVVFSVKDEASQLCKLDQCRLKATSDLRVVKSKTEKGVSYDYLQYLPDYQATSDCHFDLPNREQANSQELQKFTEVHTYYIQNLDNLSTKGE